MGALADDNLQKLLRELHEKASGDQARWADREARGSDTDSGYEILRLSEFYLAISPQEGELLYLLARASKAHRLVEFGASFGISTLYLAAAAADNGGHLFTTEVQPEKCAAARAHLKRASLTDHATLLEGDARETLKGIDGPVDFLLLDGWKGMYLSVFELLRPKMAKSALVAADNWSHDGAADYVAHVLDSRSGFTTRMINYMGISCFTD
ncbi:MAG: methyltransferase [Hyphomicrobiales bacterium]|nr:methyltransferase [Hyphomicrobiales bacterium]MCP5002009.1 methyltransferase [Hyphomicrobiales bacterium]